MATEEMQELSKSLGLSLNEQSPDDYIRKTLRAHGFFNHFETRSSRSRSSRRRERRSVPGVISEEDKRRTTQLISHFREGKEFHTLKEPHHLYGHSQNGQLQQDISSKPPFWPAEVHCIRERPALLMTSPKFSEPYHVADQEVLPPKVRSVEGYGKTVYLNLPGPDKYYIRSRRGPSVNLPVAELQPLTDTTLQFESRFESGNLGKVVQVGRWDYELYLRHDLYTKKYTQWYYFRVRNMQAGQTYRFTIVNLYKAGSLYNEGMQPVFYSEHKAREQKLGWHRAGHNIKYFKTTVKRQDKKQESFCYGVTWSHTFSHSGDTCYFAHGFPYTYSDLQEYLRKILAHREKAKFCKYRVLCHTIAGNPVPLLTITSPSLTPDDSQAKRGVVVTARVHPGETNGSWMMKGLLDFLTSSADDAKILRDLFVFKIVPMLNPDGVIIGNYRASLTGRDLNRNYRTTLKDSYPTVWYTRNMVKQFCREREVVMYSDLHGHTRKHNIFIYGCDTLNDPTCRLKSRVFPRMLSKNAPDMFSFKSSRFVVQKSKEGTGRIVMWREAGIQNSYTVEATFAGSTQGKLNGIQFSTAHLEDMGYHLCDTLLDYCDPDQSKTESIMRELEEDYRKSVLAALAELGQELPPGVDPLDIEIDPALAEGDSSDAGSDSSESDGPPVHLQWKKQQKHKKKKLKSRKERNRRKAMLKMNHHRSLSIPAPSDSRPTGSTEGTTKKTKRREMKLDEKQKRSERMTQQQPCDILESSHPSSQNGGIPLFVQERLEERHRRREEDDCSTSGVPPDELRQALLRIQATHTQQSLSSTMFIPHPGCPLNISQVNMHEITRRQSRWNSKASLPQMVSGSLVPPELPPLIPAARSSRGGFTSQYMAHHLQQIGMVTQSGFLPHEPGTINSTKNLANLSRLLRQLHPQPVGQDSHWQRPHSQQEEKDRMQAESTNQADEVNPESNSSQTTTVSSPKTKDRLPGMTGAIIREQNIAPRDSRLSMHHSKANLCTISNTNPSSETRRTESGNFSRGSPTISSSLASSSWESFSQEVQTQNCTQRQTDTHSKRISLKKERDRLRKKEKTRSKAQITERKAEAKKVILDADLGMARERERVTTEFPTITRKVLDKEHYTMPARPTEPAINSSPVFTHLPPDQRRTAAIMAHKQGIINAMEHTRTPWLNSPQQDTSHTSEYRITATAPHISKSRSDPLPSSRLLTPLPKNYTNTHLPQSSEQHSSPKQNTSLVNTSRERVSKSRAEAHLQPMEHTHSTRKSMEHVDNTRAYYDEMTPVRPVPSHTVSDHDYQTSQHRVYCSKPPTRCGPRPGPDDGVPPTRVSIMLARRPGSSSRPGTIHRSRRKHGKNPHIHYFTNKPQS